MSSSMEKSSNWSNSEFWSSNLPKVICESCDSCNCHHIYMSGTTYNMMIHFDSNNNSKINSKRFGFRNNNGLWRIKTRRFTLDFEDIYDYSKKTSTYYYIKPKFYHRGLCKYILRWYSVLLKDRLLLLV